MVSVNYLARPSALYDGLVSQLLLPLLLRLDRRVTIASGVRFRGSPIFSMAPESHLTLGTGVIINSWPFTYHTLMASCCYFNIRGSGRVLIGANTRIHGSAITAYERVTIGENCLVAAGSIIMDCGGHPVSFPHVERRIEALVDGQPNVGRIAPVVIEDCVFVGTGCIVMPGVRIGYGSVVAAGSVVTKDVAPYSVVAGNPATVVRRADPLPSTRPSSAAV